jgi:hypothetical protein
MVSYLFTTFELIPSILLGASLVIFGGGFGAFIGAVIGATIGVAIRMRSQRQLAREWFVQPSAEPSSVPQSAEPPFVQINLSQRDVEEMIQYFKKEKELNIIEGIITSQCLNRTITKKSLLTLQKNYDAQMDQQTLLLKQWRDRGLLDELRKMERFMKY